MNLINFGQAVGKWQKKLGLEEKSLYEKKMLIHSHKLFVEKTSQFRDFFSDIFCLNEWEYQKQIPVVQHTLELLHKVVEFESFINEFINTLFLYKVPCYLSDAYEKYQYRPYPYIIFHKYKREIVETGGYVDINKKSYLICFDEFIFNDFLEKVKETYKTVEANLVWDAGRHIPEIRALTKGLTQLSDKEIKHLHAVVDKDNNNKTALAEKLQTFEPSLSDKWAMNIAILLKKIYD